MLEYKTNSFNELCKKGRDTHLTKEEQFSLETVFNTLPGIAINKIIDRLGLTALNNALRGNNTDWYKGQVEILKQLKSEFNIEINKYKKQKTVH